MAVVGGVAACGGWAAAETVERARRTTVMINTAVPDVSTQAYARSVVPTTTPGKT